MNKLQQEIKDFHELIKPTLYKVLEQCNNEAASGIYNNVINPCKRLIQKCSFKSSDDTGRLCALTYWLYIYEYKQLALEICELTRNVNFDIEYGIGDISNIYGLEIRIARELLGENRKDIIPYAPLDYFLSKRVKKELRYPQILREEELTDCNDRVFELHLLSALYDMIGKVETGLYSELNENRNEIEQAIIEYIGFLRAGTAG